MIGELAAQVEVALEVERLGSLDVVARVGVLIDADGLIDEVHGLFNVTDVGIELG